MYSRIALVLCACLVLNPFNPAYLPASGLAQSPSVPDSLYTAPPHPNLLERAKTESISLPDTQANLAKGIDRAATLSSPPSGNFNLLVVLVDFSDYAGQVSASSFDQLVFGATPSVADYYDEISYGNFTILPIAQDKPSVLGWIQASNPYTYYVQSDNGFGNYPNNLQGIVADIVPKLDQAGVDFSQYDNDGDGFVDGITFVHPGPGGEWTGSPNDIWSSAWNMTGDKGPGPILVDNVWVNGFSFDTEYVNTPGDQTIGMYCHELGHMLFGLPDLYDYDYSSNGVGFWSLMGDGAWAGPLWMGESPAWPDAWSRSVMGFETPTTIYNNYYAPSGYPFQPVENLGGPGSGQVVRLESPSLGAEEYFLVEYRDKTVSGSYDAYLPGSGLLVWHIDEEKWNNWEMNTYECTGTLTSPFSCAGCAIFHPLVALEQADGLQDLEYANNYGDNGDPFGANLVTGQVFAVTSNPDSGSYMANPCPSDSCIAMQVILSQSQFIIVDLRVNCLAGSSPPLSITITEPQGWALAGTDETYTVMVTNRGSSSIVTLAGNSAWPVGYFDLSTGVEIVAPSAFIPTGQSWRIGMRVSVPAGTPRGVGSPTQLTAAIPGFTYVAIVMTHTPECILLVDDDRGMPNVENTYLIALQNNKLYYDLWDTTLSGSPDPGTLAAHEMVIWFTGVPFYATITPRQEMALADYLDGGGNLFLSSQDYLYDVGPTAFSASYLRIKDFTDNTGFTNSIQGVAGNPVGNGIGLLPFTSATPNADLVLPLSPATTAFESIPGPTPNSLTYDSGTSKLLFLAWPFENLLPDGAKTVMAVAASWMGVPPIPIAGFTVAPVLACSSSPLTFTNTSTDATAFLWDFGDGITSTLTDTVHTYTVTTPQTYSVELSATNCCGLSSFTLPIPITPLPGAGFEQSAENVLVGETVFFTSTSTYADSLVWDFGDGVTSTLAAPTHAYAQNGAMIVSLSATNGCSSEVFTHTITVYQAAIAGFMPSTTLAAAGDMISFTNTSQNADTYTWDFGDGAGTSTETNPTYAYTNPGSYVASLLSANAVSSDTYTQTIVIYAPAVAGFTPSATIVEVNNPVTFTNTSQNADTYAWDFGDGTGTSTDVDPTYTYASPGSFIVTLEAANAHSSDVYTQTITVYEPAVAGFTPSATLAEAGTPLSFANTSQHADSYGWDFGDGIGTSTETNPIYIYTHAGTYTVTLEAANAYSTDMHTRTVVIYAAAVAGFTPSATQVLRGEQIHFINSSLNADTYAWDFGDGAGTSTQADPYYAYALAGTYTVTLMASNAYTSDTVQAVITVSEEQIWYTTYLPIINKTGQAAHTEITNNSAKLPDRADSLTGEYTSFDRNNPKQR